MQMHPLVKIPMRTCMMVYMVHLTNQMAMKAPVPNIQEILRQNPEIARQMANEAMKTQTQQFRQQAPSQSPPQPQPQRQIYSQPPPQPQPARQEPQSNPLSGLMNFLGATQQPPPQNTNILPQVQTKKISMPTKSMPPPQMPSFISKPQSVQSAPPPRHMGAEGGIANILSSIKSSSEKAPPKSVIKRTPTTTPTKSPKNSVVIKL
jgi:hypothetical protein